MSALQNEINRLNTLRESFDGLEKGIGGIRESVDNLTNLTSDSQQGKIKVAAAISQKGIPSTSADSYSDMAVKIKQIKQTNYYGTTDYDEMQFPMECSYNAYRFAKDLMESELPAKYPSYLQDYLVGYGANSFWVGEFAIPAEEVLVLSMADAYYTSDGHFYTHIDGLVTHTLPDGSVETYESDVLEHKCPFNGMGNILIAHIYASDTYSVQSYNNTNLLGVMACGTCNGFTFANPINYIQSLGEISGLTLPANASNVIYPPICIKGLKKINVPLFNNTSYNEGCLQVMLPDAEEISSALYNTARQRYKSLILPRLHTNKTFILSSSGSSESELVFLYVGLRTLSYHSIETSSGGANYHRKLKVLYMPELEDMNGYSFNSGANGYFAKDTLELIYTPKLKIVSKDIFYHGSYNNYISWKEKLSLIDFEVGEVETDLNCSWWTATNVLADPEKTIQLQNNIHNHIAERVKDVTGEVPLTITFSQGVRDVLLPETEALFAAKNWNIAPAKTV